MTTGSRAPTSSGELLLETVPSGSEFVRIHQTKDAALWFGPKPNNSPAYRFDAPRGQYRTLYGARRLEGAFAETILRQGRRIIARDYVELRQWSVIRTLRELRLVQLYDYGLAWHGVTADICAGDDYASAQQFAAGLHGQHPDLDGIAYRARHNNGEICYALFDRVDPAHLSIVDFRRFENERVITDELMRRYNANWDPRTPLPPA